MTNQAPYLVFGATGAIGQTLARSLAADGHRLHLAARDAPALAAIGRELNAATSPFDALDDSSIAAAVAAAAEGAGIAGLAWCVGSIVLKPLGRATAADFADAYRLNVIGAALAVKAAQSALAQAKGAVLLFSSVAAGQGFPQHSVIASAKGAVEALALSLAAELAPNVRVNCIAPSLTRSKMAAAFLSNPSLEKAMDAMHPLGRIGTPEDAAALGAFLLGPKAGWITGQIVGVDGGRGSLRVKA
jgi:NAD(P)-dependent dehydrogenase (short-subunit alcohol dehydrogenase family)